jgi:dGTPase
MDSLKDRLQQLGTSIAPYAAPLAGTLGRKEIEPPDDTRFPFQRDRDRIIHTQAFRRLQGKTQVFVAGEGDHYRTRLTHTMEVAQVARDMARTLRLNEDLAECLALAHDLGHPPFGHAGEEAIDTWMREHGSSFEHNHQTLRIVTLLEEHSPLHKGLNLNLEVIEGLQKHRPSPQVPLDPKALQQPSSKQGGLRSASREQPDGDKPPRGLSLEAQIVDCADQIAYTGHDSDDGLAAGIFTIDEVTDVPLAKRAAERAKARGTSLRGSIIHLLVHDLYETTQIQIAEKGIRSLDDIYARHQRLAHFSAAMTEDLKMLRNFLWERMYLSDIVLERNTEGQRIVTSLCTRYLADPPEKILHLQKRTSSSLAEAVKDYVAGMTDPYAKSQL